MNVNKGMKSLEYLEIVVRTTTSGSELFALLLEEIGSTGAVIEDRADVLNGPRPEGDWAIIDESIVNCMDEDVLVKGYIPSDERAPERLQTLRARIDEVRGIDLGGIDLGKAEVSVSSIADDDWQTAWRKHYKPFRVGKRLVVKPSWEEYEAAPDDIVLELDPGLAFGTGTHETTALCLALLEGEVRPGIRVLDVGCGSGILSMAAAKLGAAEVLAIDIDPVAARVSKENVENAGLSDVVTVRVGDLVAADAGVAELCVANIIADAIIRLAEPLRPHLCGGRRFIASGIIRDREQDVCDALERAGYRVLDVRREGEWVAVLSEAV